MFFFLLQSAFSFENWIVAVCKDTMSKKGVDFVELKKIRQKVHV